MIREHLLGLAVLLATLPAMGQFEVSWYTVDGGGQTSSAGGSFELGGTIGQPDAGPIMSGGGYQLAGGFWAVTQVCYCPGDMNGDGKKNGADIQQFVGCVVNGGNCSCADVDGVGGITVADVPAFVNSLLAGSTCP